MPKSAAVRQLFINLERNLCFSVARFQNGPQIMALDDVGLATANLYLNTNLRARDFHLHPRSGLCPPRYEAMFETTNRDQYAGIRRHEVFVAGVCEAGTAYEPI